MKPPRNWSSGPEDDGDWWAISIQCHEDWRYQPQWEVVVNWPRRHHSDVRLSNKITDTIRDWCHKNGAAKTVIGQNYLLFESEEVALLFFMLFKR